MLQVITILYNTTREVSSRALTGWTRILDICGVLNVLKYGVKEVGLLKKKLVPSVEG